MVKQKLPGWLKVRYSNDQQYRETASVLSDLKLNTICESGLCPNRSECFSHGVATFLLLGDKCTRNCRYCNVSSGKPGPIDKTGPLRIVQAIKKLNLSYVVLTSVARDDLPDGGTSVFIKTVQQINKLIPGCQIELLIPDLPREQLPKVVDLNAAIISHNIETVEALFPFLRPQGDYQRSLRILKEIKENNPQQKTKSGLMLGLGENEQQIEKTLLDLKNHCDFLTLGQYLQPSLQHYPVKRYYLPEEFEQWRQKALKMGFRHVESGPLVRSSYRADKLKVHL